MCCYWFQGFCHFQHVAVAVDRSCADSVPRVSFVLCVMIMVCAIFFKFSELTDLDDINELMSDEQRHVSPPNNAAYNVPGVDASA